MEFRNSCLQDVPQLEQIVRDAVEQLRAAGVPQWQKGYPNREIILQDIEQGVGYVMAEGGLVLGMLTILTSPEPSYAEIDGAWPDDAPYASLHRVCVAKGHKGRGIAGAMFAAAEPICRRLGFSSIRIDTEPHNLPMQQAVMKAGYRPCGMLKIVRNVEAGDPRIGYQKNL